MVISVLLRRRYCKQKSLSCRSFNPRLLWLGQENIYFEFGEDGDLTDALDSRHTLMNQG